MERKKQLAWTLEMREFVSKNYHGITTKELTERFNNYFNVNATFSQISSYKKRNGLKNGIDGRFKKGQTSHNKGKKMPHEVYEKAKKTMFKKGGIPSNHKQIGSERINVDGYVEIKVAEPNIWKLKHRVVWEKHYGKVPADSAVLILDRNKTNCDISNLKLIKRKELLVMNRCHLFQKTAELNDSASNLARMINVQNESIKERKKCLTEQNQ